jgi:hypothetical protein
MEEISFSNFFRFISSGKVQVPVVETALVQNEIVDALLFNDEQGFVRKRPMMKTISLNMYFMKLLEENDWKNRLKNEKNNKICWFFKKTSRTLVLDTRIKEILNKPRYLLNIDFVQKYVESLNSTDRPLTLKLVYLNKQYIADIVYGQAKVNDPIILNLIFDIGIVLIHAFETSYMKRVVQIEIEYIKESPSRVLLSNVNKCILIEAKYTLHHPLSKAEDLDNLLKSLPKNLNHNKSPKTVKESDKLPTLNQSSKEKSIYTFKRGQLRNVNSNLESPIRITPSCYLQEDLPSIQSNDEKMQDSVVNLNYASESPDLIDEKAPDKMLIKDLLKGFFIKKSLSVPSFNERLMVKSPLESQKWSNQGRRQQGLMPTKTLPKINAKTKRGYGSDFIELVMNTYCKHKDNFFEGKSGDFGLPANISSDEFKMFINGNDSGKERNGEKVIIEESYNSGSSSPVESFPRIKFEMQFVSNILKKRKDIFRKIKRKKNFEGRTKILSLILKSPRGKNRGFDSQVA